MVSLNNQAVRSSLRYIVSKMTSLIEYRFPLGNDVLVMRSTQRDVSSPGQFIWMQYHCRNTGYFNGVYFLIGSFLLFNKISLQTMKFPETSWNTFLLIVIGIGEKYLHLFPKKNVWSIVTFLNRLVSFIFYCNTIPSRRVLCLSPQQSSPVLSINTSENSEDTRDTHVAPSFWWLAESPLWLLLLMLSQNFGKVAGPTNDTFSFNEYRLSGEDTQPLPAVIKFIHSFLYSAVVGTLKHLLHTLHSCSHPNEPPGETSTT